MHDEICRRAVHPDRGYFVRAYGSTELDVSLLHLPLVGFLPPSDERVARPRFGAYHVHKVKLSLLQAWDERKWFR